MKIFVLIFLTFNAKVFLRRKGSFSRVKRERKLEVEPNMETMTIESDLVKANRDFINELKSHKSSIDSMKQ